MHTSTPDTNTQNATPAEGEYKREDFAVEIPEAVEGEEEEILYVLSDANVDDILADFGTLRCSTLSPDFDGIEDMTLQLTDANIAVMESYPEELPEAVAYMAMRTHPETINRGGSTELQIVTDLIPYQWPAEFNGMFPTPIQLVLATVDDKKLTPSVLQAVGKLNKSLENMIVIFEKV